MKLTLFACMIAVAANHMVAANPPPVARGNCVFPSQSDFRCNAMERVDAATQAAMRAELTAFYDNLVSVVASGDTSSLEHTWMPDGTYFMGEDLVLIGWDEIGPFERSFVKEGGSTFVYSNLEWLILSDRHAVMTGGNWEIDGLTGRYISSEMYKQDDGSWKMLYIKQTPN